MIPLAVASLAAVAAAEWRPVRPALAWVAGTAAGLAAWQPGPAGAGAVLVLSGWAVRRLGADRRRERCLAAEVVLLAELAMLGVSAGRSFPAALAGAAAEVDTALQGEVAGVLARARVDGHAVALAAAAGRARELYRLAGRALATGAPLAGSLAGFVAAARSRERARRLAAAARLPVRLLVPLTLLILPGFVVLTAGPALLAGLERLGP